MKKPQIELATYPLELTAEELQALNLILRQALDVQTLACIAAQSDLQVHRTMFLTHQILAKVKLA